MINDRLIYRHRLWVRITHWINVVCMTILLMSGLQIFNAHPALYWGNASNFDHPLVAIGRFPDWATLPGSQWLAMGRRWHFFFAWLFVANGMIYTLLAIFGEHLRSDLLPSRQDLRRIGHSIRRTCGNVSLRAQRRSATMSCKSSPIWWFWAYCVQRSFSPGSPWRRSSTPATPGCSGSLAAASRRARSTLSVPSRSSPLS
jgi:cytochrome b subunit of formate dehydrogenase